jgi:tight adherence protein B
MLRLKVKALTAEGRLSAVFLSAMPFLLVGVITLMSPIYFTSVLNHPLIPPALVLGLASLLIGNVVMYRMVNFKY